MKCSGQQSRYDPSIFKATFSLSYRRGDIEVLLGDPTRTAMTRADFRHSNAGSSLDAPWMLFITPSKKSLARNYPVIARTRKVALEY